MPIAKGDATTMSLITLYTNDEKKGQRRPFYKAFHPLSAKYLFREGEGEGRFISLRDLDGSSVAQAQAVLAKRTLRP